MDAYDGYCMSKGIKVDGSKPGKPTVDDVRRWKAMLAEETGG